MSEVLSGTRSYKLLPKPQPGLLSTHTDRLTSNWLSLQQPQDPRLPVTVDLGLLILDDLAASEFGIALEPVRQLNTRICLKTLLLVVFSDPEKGDQKYPYIPRLVACITNLRALVLPSSVGARASISPYSITSCAVFVTREIHGDIPFWVRTR